MQAKLRILCRHKELGMGKDQPLAVYRKQAGSKQGIYMIKKGVIKKINTAGQACILNWEEECTCTLTKNECSIAYKLVQQHFCLLGSGIQSY